MEPFKTMLILWKWDELRKNPLKFDAVSVQSPGNDLLIRVSDENKEDQSEIVTRIYQAVKTHAPAKADLLLLLHKTALSSTIYPQIQNAIPQARKIRSFGGGDNFIYFKESQDTGLLNQTGAFADGEFYARSVRDNNGRMRLMRFRGPSVLAAEKDLKEKNKSVIISKYFDGVWNYYIYESKKRIYEFLEEMYIALAGHSGSSQAVGLPLLLANQNQEMKAKLDYLFTPKFQENMVLTYEKNPEVLKNFWNLKNFIEAEPWSVDYLKKARAHFSEVLNSMPESIY